MRCAPHQGLEQRLPLPSFVLDQHASKLERRDAVVGCLKHIVGAADVGEVPVAVSRSHVSGSVERSAQGLDGPVVRLIAAHETNGSVDKRDRDLPLVDVAPKSFFGYEADEVIGMPITILFPPELDHEEELILTRIKRGERIEHYETIRQCKDGMRIPISLTVSPIFDAAGQVVGASKIAHDISLGRRAERSQAALYEFTDRLLRAGSVDDIYEAALDAIIRALECDRASVLRFDSSGVMKFAAWRGLSDGYRQAVEGHSPWTAETKDPQPICVSNADTAELGSTLRATVNAEGIGALAFIPLTTRGGLIGKFMAYYPTVHVFTDEEITIALTIARQLAFGLERMQVEAARQHAEEAKELLLNESKHRIRNTLATAQAIARQTLRNANPDELEALVARLHARSWRGP
jgi:PAS domain S-box-containing protein